MWREGGPLCSIMDSIPRQTAPSGTQGHRTQMNTIYSLLGGENLLQLPDLRGSSEAGP